MQMSFEPQTCSHETFIVPFVAKTLWMSVQDTGERYLSTTLFEGEMYKKLDVSIAGPRIL